MQPELMKEAVALHARAAKAKTRRQGKKVAAVLAVRRKRARMQPKAKEVVVYEQGASAGSASAQRDRATRSKARPALARKAPLARGRSFFGLRGGTSARKGATGKPDSSRASR